MLDIDKCERSNGLSIRYQRWCWSRSKQNKATSEIQKMPPPRFPASPVLKAIRCCSVDARDSAVRVAALIPAVPDLDEVLAYKRKHQIMFEER